MAEHYPAMDIHIPPYREPDFVAEMKKHATASWSPQPHDAFHRPAEKGWLFFHRDIVDDAPSVTLCLHRETEGEWIVQAIVPDEGQINPIPLDVYKSILRDFDEKIAEPAAKMVEGMTAIEVSTYRLDDYFSQLSVSLLERFCKTSNQCDRGTHPSDQEKWIAFLLAAYDDGKGIHCDVFGKCLETAGWWPVDGIRTLVSEYDFAMRLLKESGR